MEELTGASSPWWARWPALVASGIAVVALGGAGAALWMRDGAPPPAVTVTVADTSAVNTAATAARVADRTPTPESPTPATTASASPAPATTPTTGLATPPGPAPSSNATPAPPAPTSPAVATASPTIASTPSASTVPSGTPGPPGVASAPYILAPQSAGIGDTFVVRVFAEGAASVSLDLGTRKYNLTPAPDRFWGLVGLPSDASPGLRTLRATARSSSGTVLGATEVPLVYVPVERPVDYLELTQELTSILTDESAATELSIRGGQFSSFDAGRRWSGKFIRPLIGPQTTAFGQGRSINGGPVGGFHSGEDIGADAGTPVHASADGRVSSVVRMPIRGLSVVIDHGSGVKSGYHHLDSALVQEGQQVVQGQVIGLVGSTGLSTGPHLHWEISVWGTNVDPVQWTRDVFEP